MTLFHVKAFYLKILTFYYDESLYRITMHHFAPYIGQSETGIAF